VGLIPLVNFGWLEKNTSPRDKFVPKTNLAVGSTEYCGCLFNESDIRKGLGGGCGHKKMIPSL
jgi:hypothetical protein